MKAAFIHRTGPPSEICCGELPDPIVLPRQVLVRVRACAVNPIDTYIRSGAVAMPLQLPFVVGCDLAGEVVAVGNETCRLRPGMRVWGSNQGLLGRQGTFSELAAVDERWLYRTPQNVSDRHAAASALVGMTAHLGLIDTAGLVSGETIVVNGASGGVGSAVVQIASALGARVIAIVGTAEKAERATKWGAHLTLNYHDPDLAARVLEAVPEGADVYWETQREPLFDQAVAMLAEGGRIIIMAGREARPEFPVGPFYVKGCKLFGFAMFKATSHKQEAAGIDLSRWMEQGKLAVPIDRVLSLSQTAEAHELQESNTIARSGILAGKIVVEL